MPIDAAPKPENAPKRPKTRKGRKMKMNSPSVSPDNYQSPVQKRRISPRVRHAVTLRVERGYKCEDAAMAAGLSPAGYFKAIKQPHVLAWMQDLKAAFIERTMADRATLRAQALVVAADLLHNSKDERIRARMVEFLAGESKNANNINVQVNVDRGGYEFARPGQRIVEIREANEGTTDVTSDVLDGQAIDNDDE